MSRVPVLLRNVIRHTDAHNKIQEESEMWKMRVMEKQPPRHRLMPATDMARGHMHCDRVEDGSRDRLRERLGTEEPSSGQDQREARYWTRKLYEFEANDPDRWGHNGFKELYPEEFQSEEEKECADNQNRRHKKKKSKTSIDAAKSKRSKKSSKKKKKKKEEKRKRGEESDGESSSGDSAKGKQKRKSGKSKHRRKKSEKGREEEEESISEDSDEEGGRGKRTQSQRKRQRDSHQGSESEPESHRKRRKNWKTPNKEKSEESSED